MMFLRSLRGLRPFVSSSSDKLETSREGTRCGKRSPLQGVLWLCLLSLVMSCSATTGGGKRRGRLNGWTKLIALGGKRALGAYDNTVVKLYRGGSDCSPNCPIVDVWQYKYKVADGTVITDTKPIATRKQFWKVKEEARIISLTLYGNNALYLNGILDYLESFKYVKESNSRYLNSVDIPIDDIWGYETFTMRVYTPKRRPEKIEQFGAMQNETNEKFIKKLLDMGVEIAYVDNQLSRAGVDAFFWRFLVLAEEMPPGQRIRYVVRDADWKFTATEAFAMGEWIHSGLRYHRMNLMPACMTPVTGSMWGGVHEGRGPFWDMADRIRYFPYRLEYGDDELFLRELVWPIMQASGSILTHVGKRGLLFYFGNPYRGSCQEPTKAFCHQSIQLGIARKQLSKDTVNHCYDLRIPKGLHFPRFQLAYNARLSEIIRKTPEAFTFTEVSGDPDGNARMKAAVRALSVDFTGPSQPKQLSAGVCGIE